MTIADEIEQAKAELASRYNLWQIADPLYEDSRWLEYQAAISRFNALIAESRLTKMEV